MIKLACFDMDRTLLSCDCDDSWKLFLMKKGLCGDCSAEIGRFAAEDAAGTLDWQVFLQFQFREFAGLTASALAEITSAHFEECIRPAIRRAAFAAAEQFRKSGVKTAILTSTSRPIAAPVAEFFKMDYLWATEAELDDAGRYTGRPAGVYLSGANKSTKLLAELEKMGIKPEEVAAFGDSINDIAMLELSGRPTAVNPGAALRRKAEECNWPVADWESAGLGL